MFELSEYKFFLNQLQTLFKFLQKEYSDIKRILLRYWQQSSPEHNQTQRQSDQPTASL